jgi:hypothetical protein
MSKVSRETLEETHSDIDGADEGCVSAGAPPSAPGDDDDGDGDGVGVGEADSREQPRRAKNARKSARMAPS